MDEYTIMTLIGGALLSAVVGMLTGIFGVGGGFLLTPALIILLNVAPASAVGTGLAVILFTGAMGLFKRRGTSTVDYRLAAFIATGAILGVLIGQYTLQSLQTITITIAGQEQPAITYILMWAFAVLLVVIAILFFLDVRRRETQPSSAPPGYLQRVRLGRTTWFASLDGARISIIPLILIGGVVGFMTGLMGIGGGVLMLPIFIYLIGLEPVRAAGTSLVLVWLSALTALVPNIRDGNIAWPLLIMMVVGGFFGAHLGTNIGLKLDSRKIRAYFIVVILAAIALVGYKISVMTFDPS